MNYVDWIRRVDAGKPGAFLLCCIQEPFLWDSVKDVLQKDVLGGARLSFNYEQLDAVTLRPEQLVSATETLPLMAERRVVVLDHVPLGRDEVSKNEALLETLAACVTSRPSHLMLVLGYHGDKPFQGRLYKKMAPELERLDLTRLDGRMLQSFIQKRFREKQVAIQHGVPELVATASEYLDARAGKTLYDVVNLVDRTAALATAGRLTNDQARDGLMTPADRNVFSLMDALGARQTGRALQLLRGYEALGEDGYRLFYLIVRQIRNLIGVKRAAQTRLSPRDAQSRLGLSSFEYGKLQRSVGNFTLEELYALHDGLYSMEVRMKTGPFDMDRELEVWVAGV